MKWWNDFMEKHPKAAQWIREGGLFVIVSNLITVFKYLLLTFLPAAFAFLGDRSFGWPGIPLTIAGETFDWNILGYDQAHGGIAYFTAYMIAMVIGECIDKWKEQSQTAYEKLKELLSDKPSELERLENSQKNWESELEDKKQEWYAPENFTKSGTMGILSADTAMMNYYKGRAAVLYQQIFVLTGNMEDI